MLAAGVLVFAMAFVLARRAPVEPQRVAGVRLQGFAGGPSVDLGGYAGRPVVVNYFASWCAPCVAEMPGFQEVSAEYGDRVAFVGVNVRDAPEPASRLVAETGVTYTLASDPDGKALVAVGGTGMPTTLFVDRRGRIVERFTGPMGAGFLRARIRKHFAV